MRKIGLKDFYNYKCISSLTLSPEGDKLAYIVSSVNEEDNDYDSNLFMMRRDAAGKNWQEVQLVVDGKAGEFFFEDNDTILFQAKRGKDQKKGEEEPITVYQRLPLGGGEARKAYEFPIPVSDLRKQPDGNYLLTGQTYVKYPDYFAMTEAGRKKVLKEIKENKDYEELTESPFWRNGEGITQGTRNTLFHYDVETGKLRRLTDTLLTVDCFEVIGGYVYVIGRTFENREEYKSGLYRIDVAAGSCTEMVRPYLQIMEMGKIDDKLIVLGSECRRYGENENPFFYVYDTAREEKDFTLLREADESVFDGVISDIEYGSWRSLKSDGNHVYYMALDGTRNVLLRIGLDGNTETVVNKEGALYDFDVLSGDLWVMAAANMSQSPNIFAQSIIATDMAMRKSMAGCWLPGTTRSEKNTRQSWISTADRNVHTDRSSSTRCSTGLRRDILSCSVIPTARTAREMNSLTLICSGAGLITSRSWPSSTMCWRRTRISTEQRCAAPAAVTAAS